ncbi:MAG TPA: TolC family protein [Mucilaginibacter sp.]
MRLIRVLIIVFVIAHLKANAQTDTISINSLAEVFNAAIKHNPTQAVYQLQIRQAQYNYKAAKGFIYPNASASFSGTDNLHLAVTPIPGILIGQPGTTFYAQFGKKYAYNTGITLGQDLVDWQSIYQAEIAKSNIRLNEVQQDSYIQSLKEQVARLYFSVLIAKASLNISKLDSIYADSLLNLSKQRLQQGVTDAISANQAAINYNNVLQNKAQSKQLYEQGIENLKILLGEKPDNELMLSENIELDLLTADELTKLGTDRSLEVYEQQIQLADVQRKSQRSSAYPKLSASAFFGGQQFRDNFGLSLNNNAFSGYRYIGLNLSVPIFTGFTNSNKYQSAVIQKEIAQVQYDNALKQSQINDRLLIKNITNYADAVKASGKSFKLYGANLQLNKQKYQEGILAMDAYLRTFQDYLTAENAYLNNLSQLLSTRATLLSRQ